MNGTVVICGTFDLYHAGHASALKYAKSLGDNLIVLLYDDAFSEELKGNKPVNPLNFRKAVLDSVKYVDRIIVVAVDLPYIIHILKANVLIEGSETDLGTALTSREVMEQSNGEVVKTPVVFTDDGDELSGSKIMEIIYKQAGCECGE